MPVSDLRESSNYKDPQRRQGVSSRVRMPQVDQGQMPVEVSNRPFH